MATLGGRTLEGSIAAALAGSLLGFLVYNFPPARVFLGDAGSMFVGLVLGALALKASLNRCNHHFIARPSRYLRDPIV